MTSEKIWSKKIFSKLLHEAQGDRSVKQFADECGISYVQMRKLMMMEQENPPRPKLIRKIADHAFGEVDLADLMFAAGLSQQQARAKVDSRAGIDAKLHGLTAKERKSAENYIDFIVWQKQSLKEQHSADEE